MRKAFQASQQSLELFKKSSCVSLMLTGPYRLQSTASTEAKPERISRNLSFRPAYDSPIEQESRPLVLLYGWLVAKSKHIHKYGDFYLKKGYDVLHIKVDPMQLMWPLNAQRVVSQVVDFTQQVQRTAQPVLVHGFSVGGYLYGETLVKILSNSETAENLSGRIQGQILDSPVDFEGIPGGVSKAVTPIPILQKTIQGSIAGYLQVTKNYTMKHYTKSSATFQENPFRTPTLFLYSKADKVSSSDKIDGVLANYKRRGIEVYGRCWPDSRHVSHFHTYPVEYIGVLNFFLDKIGLLTESEPEKIRVAV